MGISIFSKSSAPTKNLRYSVPKSISLPRTRPQHCFVIASCGASCGRGSQLLFFSTQSSCRWHWMPVNLQLVRVLFSSRCEQSFWQRRADIFFFTAFEINRSTERRVAYQAIGLSMVGLRSAVQFSGATDVTPKCHMQG